MNSYKSETFLVYQLLYQDPLLFCWDWEPTLHALYASSGQQWGRAQKFGMLSRRSFLSGTQAPRERILG